MLSCWLCAEASATELLSCNFTTPRAYDPYLVLHKLYGPWFEPTNPGAGSLLVLGQHNSGTSMLARLIMLMGAFQGNVKGTINRYLTACLALLFMRRAVTDEIQVYCRAEYQPHQPPQVLGKD